MVERKTCLLNIATKKEGGILVKENTIQNATHLGPGGIFYIVDEEGIVIEKTQENAIRRNHLLDRNQNPSFKKITNSVCLSIVII